ncbi:filamentous hemagglutinin N-terminal domain-containing protein, partial [Xanthomonas campestris pv. phormiicola]|nr:filamentous hemagglutinin N-terminal domain-containing protein [Xanthomonas campestris pv. phormiicola]
MNRIYRLVFNRNLGVLQVASEAATGHAGGGLRGAARLSAPLLPLALAWALAAPAHAGGLPSLSAASGATVAQNGSTLTIDQNAAKAVLNWNSFNVGKDASVVFVQPSSSAVALNLIDAAHGASSIDGSLRANGNVFLINSAGILFGSNAKVNVGGLVASSLGLAEDDDNAYVLARGDHAAASVVNRGSIAASGGGSVNLVGNHVANSGAIAADNGAIRLLSADRVKVTMDTAGAIGLQLVAAASQSVDGTEAAVENSGRLRAGGGQILLQAASSGLSDLLINNTGTIEASAIDSSGGSVRFVANGGAIASSGSIDVSGSSGGSVQLLSDAAVNVSGRIDASGTTAGGGIRIGGGYQGGENLLQASSATVASDAVLDASATGAGNGGSIVVWSNGHTAVHGSLAANGAGNGDGGLLETSGHTVDFSGIAVAAKAAGTGAAGTWLVDPEDLSVDSAAASTIGSTLDGGTNVTLITTSTTASGPGTVSSGGSGDINVNSAISWSGNTTLTLDAYHDINVNAAITATGSNAGLVLNYGGYTANGAAASGTDYNVNAPITLGGRNAQLSINGDAYTLLRSLDDLQNVVGNTGNYALAGDLDASGTSYGSPIMARTASGEFSGTFAGLGHTISNLSIDSGNYYVGLFGYVGTATIRDLGLVDASVSGSNYVGALAGTSRATLSNVYSTGSVTGGNNVGGLVGYNSGQITGAHSASNVSASSDTSGGLVGMNDNGVIEDSYANGNVTSNSANVGGLAGRNAYGTISGSYATGSVTGKSYVGGLVGFNDSYGVLTNVYATGNVVGTAYITGGLVGMNYQGTITNAYATGSVLAPTSVGGLVGVNNPGSQSTASSSISDSYATGAVSGTNNVGGLVG